MGVEIRQATSDDYEMIHALYAEYRPDWNPHKKLKDYLNTMPSALSFEGENLIGFAYSFPYAPDIIELANMYVEEKHQNKNVGSKILKFIEGQIEESNYKGLLFYNSDLHVSNKEKKDASRFYIKNGYRKIAETENTRVFFKNF